MTHKKLRRIMPIVGLIVVVGGTYLAIQFGKGYRPGPQGLSGTGLLAANSFPDGAEVYLNDKLATATDDTINLPPEEYSVTIKKEGFIPWNKTLTIKNELVTQTNASLFRSVPSLSPLTLNGASNLNPSPDGQRIAYTVASASAALKNGLYILDLSANTFTPQQSPRQIAQTTGVLDFSQVDMLWSPDSSQILVNFTNAQGTSSNHLLETDTLNNVNNLPDVTARLPIILAEWEEQIVVRETTQFALLPEELQHIATQSAVNVYFSPNDNRVMYTATDSAKLPDNIIPEPLAVNTQPQTRDITPGSIYIYDIKEDRNFRLEENVLEDGRPYKSLLLQSHYHQPTISIASPTPPTTTVPITAYNQLQDSDSVINTFNNFRMHYSSIYTQNYQWYPDSSHLLITLDDKIDLIEYDSTNWITLYSGPFENNFNYPWPDGTKIVILTNLNPSSTSPHNLYSIEVK